MGLARLRQALPSALPILLGVLLLLLPVVTGQPGTETTDPSPEEQLQSKLAPYAPYIGGIIAAMGGILGESFIVFDRWVLLEEMLYPITVS